MRRAARRTDRVTANRETWQEDSDAGAIDAVTSRRPRSKRGAQGVWSGLWSLPEADDPTLAVSVAARIARVGDADPLPAFTHVFSHYRLDVSPILFDHAAPLITVADRPDRRWCGRDEIAALGLPAPVRTLLDNLPEISP
jgi:A/G-specific adenine glycosylase